ncbi:hypothetical protein WMF31_19980 [Sorangium sp. So ce1036]|uniref:hypothetical protein n=1 Tax=Sorangium sp. So ce1036 TaxID=3133328 RepID=UPI003F04E111
MLRRSVPSLRTDIRRTQRDGGIQFPARPRRGQDGPREHEPEDWADIVQRFGGEPAVVVSADVSGRHRGDEQVAGFVAGLLSRFSGAAMDDDTAHLGSLDELRGGHRVQGHPFFDYNGWFAEKSR